MFAVYICPSDGHYNPFDGGIYGPFDTVDEAKAYCQKDSDEQAVDDGGTPFKLNWLQDTFDKKVNLGAEGYFEACYLVQEMRR
jgi:hypothetical protein